ncbi:hypothetical protein WA158_005672 [Blastocystis sp. Blastoise]
MENPSESVPISYVWQFSFPFEEYDEFDSRVAIIKAFVVFFHGAGASLLYSYTYDLNQTSIVFEWQILSHLCPLEDLKMVLVDHPEDTLGCLSAAVQIVTAVHGVVNSHLKVRIANLEPYYPIRDIKAHSVGKFICIKGTVIRVSGIRSLVNKMAFKCMKCDSIMQVTFIEGKFSPPNKCVNSNCRGKIFNPIRQSAITEDLQTIRVQEMDDVSSTSLAEAGRIPRSIEVQCLGDLVDVCVPGEVVVITGIVKSECIETSFPGKNNRNSLFLLYVRANCISTQKIGNDSSRQTVVFSEKDMKAINFIAQQPNLFNLILHSLCPSIYGQDLVKAGLCLALAGGVSGEGKRGDIHVLMVGDPGLGKSQLLRAVSRLNIRSVYICGNATTGSGLTVTMSKDKTTGESALEAGALILSDGGICCIDEFDKMGSEQQVLLEAMEHQTISIAKAGIVCTLSSRSGIIAAANPSGGHYNRGKTVAENIKMSPGLLSRFDIIFLLLDSPDEYRDTLLSEHIMNNYARALRQIEGNGNEEEDRMENNLNSQSQYSMPSQYTDRLAGDKLSIAAKYREGARQVTDPIPPVLLKKYFAYIRQYIHPKLTAQSAAVLKEFYLSLRQTYSDDTCTPITTRQIESLIRLAQARARIEMRETVTVEDAEEVVCIMKESLFDVVSDDMGFMNFEKTTGMSKSKIVKSFIAILTREAQMKGSNLFTIRDLIDIAHKSNLAIDDIHDFVDLLNQQAYLLKKGGQMYQLQTS